MYYDGCLLPNANFFYYGCWVGNGGFSRVISKKHLPSTGCVLLFIWEKKAFQVQHAYMLSILFYLIILFSLLRWHIMAPPLLET